MMFPTETGLDVIFRKKPTAERGSQDGGLKITVEEVSVLWDSHRVPGATRSTVAGGKAMSSSAAANPADSGSIVKGRQGGAEQHDTPRATISVVRISEGQVVSKNFSEKLVVKRMMDALKSLDAAMGRPVSFVSSFVALAE